jgi:hypothetical protein
MMELMRRVALTLLVVLIGCGEDGGAAADPDAGMPDAGPAVDPSDALFDPDHVVEVSITLAASDWAQLRDEPDTIGLPKTTCA